MKISKAHDPQVVCDSCQEPVRYADGFVCSQCEKQVFYCQACCNTFGPDGVCYECLMQNIGEAQVALPEEEPVTNPSYPERERYERYVQGDL